MDTKLVNTITSDYKKVKHPVFGVGDVVEVHIMLEGAKKSGEKRIQIFKGVVIAIKNSGISKTFTVRKISYGVGVEKIFPLYCPSLVKIKIIKRCKKVRRSKLYYLRNRTGKAALKVGVQVPVEGKDLETQIEDAGITEGGTETVKDDSSKDSKQKDTKEGKADKDKDSGQKNTKEGNTGKDTQKKKKNQKDKKVKDEVTKDSKTSTSSKADETSAGA